MRPVCLLVTFTSICFDPRPALAEYQSWIPFDPRISLARLSVEQLYNTAAARARVLSCRPLHVFSVRVERRCDGRPGSCLRDIFKRFRRLNTAPSSQRYVFAMALFLVLRPNQQRRRRTRIWGPRFLISFAWLPHVSMCLSAKHLCIFVIWTAEERGETAPRAALQGKECRQRNIGSSKRACVYTTV